MLAVLDRLRRQWLALGGPLLAPLHRDQALRIALLTAAGVVSSFALTLLAPLVLFTLSPLLLGVPHLVSDVRYLVVQPALHRMPRLAFSITLPLLSLWLWPMPSVGLASALTAVLLSGVRTWRAGLVALLVSSAMVLSYRFGWASSLAITHLHNVVAIGMAFLVFAPTLRAGLLPTVLYGLGSTALLSGVVDRVLLREAALAMRWVDLQEVIWLYAPDGVSAAFAFRVVAWFVFSQSVHYVIWLRAIPDAARDRPGMRGFASSLRALHTEMGSAFLVVAALVWGVLLLLCFRSFEFARRVYLNVAAFHAYLEFAVLALWLAAPTLLPIRALQKGPNLKS